MSKSALLLLLTLAVDSAAVRARDVGERFLLAAREPLGTPYRFGGRLGPEGGLDCLGVLFYAAERVSRCDWRSYGVMPAEAIARGELGARVLGPVATADLDLAQLQPGDVLWLVGPLQNARERAAGKLAGADVWVWHTGVYAGDGRFVVGDHYAGEVVETALLDYLRAHADAYSGLVATRLGAAGPRPARCRSGARMQLAALP